MPLIRIPPSVLHIKYQGQAPLVSGKQKRYGLGGDGFNQLELQRDSVSLTDLHGSTPLQGFKSGVWFSWKDPYKYIFVYVCTYTVCSFKSLFILFCVSVGGLLDLFSETTSRTTYLQLCTKCYNCCNGSFCWTFHMTKSWQNQDDSTFGF